MLYPETDAGGNSFGDLVQRHISAINILVIRKPVTIGRVDVVRFRFIEFYLAFKIGMSFSQNSFNACFNPGSLVQWLNQICLHRVFSIECLAVVQDKAVKSADFLLAVGIRFGSVLYNRLEAER